MVAAQFRTRRCERAGGSGAGGDSGKGGLGCLASGRARGQEAGRALNGASLW
ncbi:MAG: hypothetical protein PHF80_06055 [Methanothrix sp.]|nr:hypothetical protein [Methanothrix sp.]